MKKSTKCGVRRLYEGNPVRQGTQKSQALEEVW
jgi:hypothetical protein